LNDLLAGRCLCGAVRYRCHSPISPPTLCHCESCRRASGAHVVGWLTVPLAALAFTAGEPVTYQSSASVRRGFCGRCGTPLTYWTGRRSDEIDITIATLDVPDEVIPVDHVWMSDALAWDRPADGLPEHLRGRNSGGA
jgi:hypothetical protein